jgi:signal transduction histidine kinase
MNFVKSLIFGLGFVAATGLAVADDRGTKDEAKAMTDAAVAHVAKVGWDKAKTEFMDKANPTWHKKDLYVFALNMAGVNQAHGANEKMVGKDIIGLKDASGREYIKDMVAAAGKGAGWVDYSWQHPETKKMEDKSSYVRKLPGADMFVGVGFYK